MHVYIFSDCIVSMLIEHIMPLKVNFKEAVYTHKFQLE